MTDDARGQQEPRLIPDDEALGALLRRADVLLETLVISLVDSQADPEPWRFPPPLADRAAVDAFDRIAEEVRARSTTWRQDNPEGPWLYAPDGRYQHTPVRIVLIDPDDLATLEATVHTCIRALAPSTAHGDPVLADLAAVIGQLELDDDDIGYKQPITGQQGLDALARVVALLDLAPDTDTQTLTTLVTDQATDIVLTEQQEAAYQRMTNRWIALISDADPLHRYQY